MRHIDARARLETYVNRYDRQEDAAKALGISGQYLRDLLQNRRPFSARMLEKLGLRQIVVEAR